MSNYAHSTRRAGFWFGNGPLKGAVIKPNKVVVHTTETTSLPPYEGGATAPHYTAIPDIRNARIAWVRHFPDEQSARALQNRDGGVETNTDDCIQIELVGTCDLATSKRWGNAAHIYWPNAPDWALKELAKFVVDMNQRHKIPIRSTDVDWVAYPKSYGLDAAQRFTYQEWKDFRGWCGHQHVPENEHGDPGNINWPAINDYARKLRGPVVTRAQQVRDHINSALVLLDKMIASKNGSKIRLQTARTALITARRALTKEN